jgi:hypothetical protein
VICSRSRGPSPRATPPAGTANPRNRSRSSRKTGDSSRLPTDWKVWSSRCSAAGSPAPRAPASATRSAPGRGTRPARPARRPAPPWWRRHRPARSAPRCARVSSTAAMKPATITSPFTTGWLKISFARSDSAARRRCSAARRSAPAGRRPPAGARRPVWPGCPRERAAAVVDATRTSSSEGPLAVM